MNSFFETAVPCCFGIVFFLLLFGFIAFMRYMGYRETLALAEKGLVKPERRSGNGTLFWGIGFTALGAALCLGLWPIGFIAGGRFPLGLGPWLLFGLVPMFFGVGLVLFYVLTREPKPAEKAVVVPVTTSSLGAVVAPVGPVASVGPVGPVGPVAPVVVQEPVTTMAPASAIVPPSEQPLPPTPPEPPTSPAP